jgi:hypothetical protein
MKQECQPLDHDVWCAAVILFKFRKQNISFVLFWVVQTCNILAVYIISEEHTASIFMAEDGGSVFLRNVDVHPEYYMT